MNARLGTAALALAALLVLAGCSESVGNATSDTLRTASETAAPLAAESPTAAPLDAEDGTEGADAEAQFVTYVREHLRPDNVIPNATDADLIAAGHEGCNQIEARVPADDLTVIEGEERDGGGYYRDSSIVITGARMFLCPEFIDG
ncbi:DUF732 domain-containing protein [Microbacterium sp. K41]|uniref:DUF732 domain-containing protein n=1 Tax=Microbacterium sp. K41 TaxID=2305437 RepID=UPI00109D20FC|nr:DUF732 domain-containing protein [Microbacterium sp. K41]